LLHRAKPYFSRTSVKTILWQELGSILRFNPSRAEYIHSWPPQAGSLSCDDIQAPNSEVAPTLQYKRNLFELDWDEIAPYTRRAIDPSFGEFLILVVLIRTWCNTENFHRITPSCKNRMTELK
jgi:hypothetical protein